MSQSQVPGRSRRNDYAHFIEVPTRWSDNDSYGHLNNAVYYSSVSYTHLTLPTILLV